jgi:hypothetical protein
MLGKTTNKLLQKVEQDAENAVPAELRSAFQRILQAGLTIIYAPETRDELMQELNKPGDIAENIGEGAAKLYVLLLNKSKGTMPPKAGVKAVTVCMCEVLGFLEEAGRVKVTADVVDNATKAMSAYILQLMHVTPDKMHQYLQAGAQAANKTQSQPSSIIASAQQGT